MQTSPLLGTNGSAPRASTGRYRAKIARVSPVSRRDNFTAEQACFLGVSLENSNFTPGKVRALVEWTSRRFDQCVVLIGDSIHRINLESRGYATEEALAEARRLGREFIDNNLDAFEEGRDSTEFTFITCDEVQDWPDYPQFHQQLCGLFDDDRKFRESIEAFGRTYHTKRLAEYGEAERVRYQPRSCDYFLEEFAIFSCLKQRDLGVMIYPGSFSTLSEITAGIHPAAPKQLQEMVVVSLQLKGR